MTKLISTLTTVAILGGCYFQPPELTQNEAYSRLLDYHTETTNGLFQDTAAIQFALVAGGSNVRRAVSTDGLRLATFRWAGGEWTMTPDPRLSTQLKRVARDRSQVEALMALVESAEADVSRFRRTLTQMMAADRGTDPWAWRLEQAGAFLLEMEEYVRSLRAKGVRLAGSEDVQVRTRSLLDDLAATRHRIERELISRSASG